MGQRKNLLTSRAENFGHFTQSRQPLNTVRIALRRHIIQNTTSLPHFYKLAFLLLTYPVCHYYCASDKTGGGECACCIVIDVSSNTLFITFKKISSTFSHTYSVDQSQSNYLIANKQNKPFKLTRNALSTFSFNKSATNAVIRTLFQPSFVGGACTLAQHQSPDSFFESGRLTFKTVVPTANVCWRYAHTIRLHVLSRPLARRPTKVV